MTVSGCALEPAHVLAAAAAAAAAPQLRAKPHVLAAEAAAAPQLRAKPRANIPHAQVPQPKPKPSRCGAAHVGLRHARLHGSRDGALRPRRGGGVRGRQFDRWTLS